MSSANSHEWCSSVTHWLFDLDNTLYPARCNLFDLIDIRMGDYVSELLGVSLAEAKIIQKKYYLEEGTTLNGLMKHHQADPEAFLDYVHDIDLSRIPLMPELSREIEALRGPKFIFSNGSKGHSERVSAKLGLKGVFDDICSIESFDYHPKPEAKAYEAVIKAFDLDPQTTCFFDDIPRNLTAAKDFGFKTVLIYSDKDWSSEPEGARPSGHMEDHGFDAASSNLTALLKAINAYLNS